MKTNAILVLLIMIVVTGLSWVMIYMNKSDLKEKYENYMTNAEEHEKKEAYITAVKNYNLAFEIDPQNYNLAITIAQNYEKLSDERGFLAACNNAVQINPKTDEPYIMMAGYYMGKSKYNEALDILKKSPKIDKQNDVNKMINEMKNKYFEIYSSYKEIKSLHYGFYVAKNKDDKYGLIGKDGRPSLGFQFKEMGAYDSSQGIFPVFHEGEWYYVNLSGYKTYVPDSNYDYLGTYAEGYSPFKYDGKYGYVDLKYKEYNQEFDYAGSFSNGVAAVCKGEKWALINSSFNNITGYEYDEIKIDEYGFCSKYAGTVIARKDKTFILLNLKGEVVKELDCDDIKMFQSKEPTAFKKGNLWGFMNAAGEVTIEPKYVDANPFSLGKAPVQDKGTNSKTAENKDKDKDKEDNENDGKWGCIDQDGKLVIDYKFDYMNSFGYNGTAVVKKGEMWSLITLYEYKGE